MELKIDISQRDLSFVLDNYSGKDLNEMIERSSEKEISSIVISGESRSYTFLRQIALFTNLKNKLTNCKIVLKSHSFKMVDGLIAPIYE